MKLIIDKITFEHLCVLKYAVDAYLEQIEREIKSQQKIDDLRSVFNHDFGIKDADIVQKAQKQAQLEHYQLVLHELSLTLAIKVNSCLLREKEIAQNDIDDFPFNML